MLLPASSTLAMTQGVDADEGLLLHNTLGSYYESESSVVGPLLPRIGTNLDSRPITVNLSTSRGEGRQ